MPLIFRKIFPGNNDQDNNQELSWDRVKLNLTFLSVLTTRQLFRNKLSSALLQFANVFLSRAHVTIRLRVMEMINFGSLSIRLNFAVNCCFSCSSGKCLLGEHLQKNVNKSSCTDNVDSSAAMRSDRSDNVTTAKVYERSKRCLKLTRWAKHQDKFGIKKWERHQAVA